MKTAVLAFVIVAVSGFTQRFDGHKVLRVIPNSAEEVESVRALESLTTSENLNWWQSPSIAGLPIDVRVSPSFYQEAINHLHAKNLQSTIHIEDVQTHFEEARRLGDGTWDTEYHPYDQAGGIVDWIEAAAKANPELVTLFEMGKTNLGRTIYGLIITKDTSGTTPVVYLDGGIHAREWMGPAVLQYIIGQYVNNSATGSDNDKLLRAFTFYIIPVWNADGYNYTWETNPEWRKNRQPNTGSACIGTDCNRNCDAGWSNVGASSDPCSDEYHGTAIWSATETAVWRDYMTSLNSKRKIVAYVNFHSNAEMWLDPYGYKAALPADYTAQQDNARTVTNAIKSINNATYVYGPIYTTIYPASGGTVDWTYDSLKITLSQACELRGNSFQPSPTLIVPIGREILAGVAQLAHNGEALYKASQVEQAQQ